MPALMRETRDRDSGDIAGSEDGMMVATWFVVQPYERSKKGRMIQRDAREWQTAEAACREAERVAAQGGAAVAFARTGDPETGDFAAVILGVYGAPPDEVLAA